MDNIVSAAKTDMFRIRINPDIRTELERIYAKIGLTLTDAVNEFFQLSLNAGGFPFFVTEDNAGQYYPDYAYNHALFTNDMRIYSDSKISDFLQEVTIDQRIRFLNEWNAKRDHREKIYISYDSTNKVSQAGDIDLVELGHAREGVETDIFNYSIAFEHEQP